MLGEEDYRTSTKKWGKEKRSGTGSSTSIQKGKGTETPKRWSVREDDEKRNRILNPLGRGRKNGRCADGMKGKKGKKTKEGTYGESGIPSGLPPKLQ